MALNKATIFNMALSAIGVKADISDPDENSLNAERCRLWYDRVREHILNAAPWKFATAHARLSLLATRDNDEDWVLADPDPGWLYKYSWPDKCVRPRFLSTFKRFDVSVDHTNSARTVLTNEEDSILTYTRDVEAITLWDKDFQWAVAFALGAVIAPAVTGKNERVDRTERKANDLILDARVNSSNDGMYQLESVPDWLQARGYGYIESSSRFIFPNGPMFLTNTYTNVQ